MPWGLLLGGALGNALDRLGPGGVVDWMRVAGYPATFNLADVAVRLSDVALATSLLLPGAGPAPGRRLHHDDGACPRRAHCLAEAQPPQHREIDRCALLIVGLPGDF